MGFEPTTSTLARLRSTTELHPQLVHLFYDSKNLEICQPLSQKFLEPQNFYKVSDCCFTRSVVKAGLALADKTALESTVVAALCLI